MSRSTVCECGFYDRDRHHSAVGGWACEHYYRRTRSPAAQEHTADLKARIMELEEEVADWKKKAEEWGRQSDEANLNFIAEMKRTALLEAALVDIREAMPGTDDAADRVQRIISNALQNQPNT